jgi:hypothetical protein
MPKKQKLNIIHGSWKNKIVSSCLKEERDRKDFAGTLMEIGLGDVMHDQWIEM